MMTTATTRNGKGRSAWPWSLLAGFSLLWLVGAIYSFSHIEIDLFAWMMLGLSGVLLAATWIVSTIVDATILIRRRTSPRTISTRRWVAWFSSPLMGGLGLWLASTDVDLLLRFRLSEAALRSRAEQLIASGETEPQQIDERVGLFRVEFAQVNDDGTVRFSMGWPGIFVETGMIYDPDQIVAETSQWPDDRQRLSEDWVKYIWSD